MRTLMTFGDVTLAQCEDGDFAVTREGEGMWLYCPGDLWSALDAYGRGPKGPRASPPAHRPRAGGCPARALLRSRRRGPSSALYSGKTAQRLRAR